MLIPSPHEDMRTNTLVTGAALIEILSTRPYNIEELFQHARTMANLTLDQFYAALMLLWLIDALDVSQHQVFLRREA